MKLTFIADTHHYSKSLGVTGKAYELRSGSDQKCLGETSEIIDSAFEQIADSDTDAVFILGDVTNDGEMVSHLEFREKLYRLQERKDVYIITATHDWCSDQNPRRYDGDNTYHDVEVMSSQDLPEFYRDFGPRQAIASFITDIGTICYTVALSDRVRVLCLNDDKNEDGHAGFTPECWQWIERQISQAREDGALIIGIEHHLIMSHSSPLICVGSVCVANREMVASRLADAGLRYMLVGHSHIQATDRYTSPAGNTITEINVGSLCGYPSPIVNVVTNDDGTLTYRVDHLEQIRFSDRTVDAQQYLRHHSSQLVNRLLESENADQFQERLSALQINISGAKAVYYVVKPILNWLNTALVGDAYRLLRTLGLANGIRKSELKNLYYKSLREMVNEVMLGLFDGARTTYTTDDVYYRLVMAVFTIPQKLLGDKKECLQLIELADYILTGGDIDNQAATI